MINVCGINKFVERDVDMLLAEELRVDADFGRWIAEKCGLSENLKFPAVHVNVSVVEDGSEADVVATFERLAGRLHRLFVENKIDAKLMPDQLERYVRRAEGGVRRQKIATFSIVFFTPSNYLRAAVPKGVNQITFEDAAQMLSARNDTRSQYRASLLMRALPLGSPAARDAHVVVTDPYIKEWWDTVYAMLDRKFKGFFLHKTRYPRSVYFAPETPGQGRYLRVDFKGHKGEVDLAFKNIPASVLGPCVAKIPGLPGQIISNGKSSAIQISGLEPFVISDGFSIIDTKVYAAYKAAYDLLTYWKLNEANFNAIAKSGELPSLPHLPSAKSLPAALDGSRAQFMVARTLASYSSGDF